MKTRHLLGAVALVLSAPMLSARGQEAWVRRAGPIVNNLPLMIRADNASNAYVSATTYVNESLYNFVTLKYAADGTTLWNMPYNSGPDSDDEAGALTVDDSGNVYVAGSSRVGADPRSLKVIKYGPNGNQLWLAEYAEADVQPVAVIRVNAVYVAGTSYSTNSGSDYITLKYDLNGNAVWARRYTGIDWSAETLAGMALDPAGNVVVTGTSHSGAGPNKIVTVKYDRDGNPVWTNSFVPPGGFNGEAKAIAADYIADIYIAVRVGYGGDSLLVRLDRDGREVWSRSTGNSFWSRQDEDITWDIESVAYGDGMFVAVGDRGRAISSPNGGVWFERFTACYTALRNVIYADGAFWAAGNNETIVKSGQMRPFLLARNRGNEFKVLIEAQIGKAHRLQSSSNLVNWSDLFNFAPTEESTIYCDSEGDKRRFYRVVAP